MKDKYCTMFYSDIVPLTTDILNVLADYGVTNLPDTMLFM